MDIRWSKNALKDIEYWKKTDTTKIKKIKSLISNIMENHTIIAIFKEKSLNTNELAAKSISIYPSPTSNNIYVTGNKKISAPELYNNNGQKVLQGSGNSMDLTKITNGVYILKIITDNGEISTSKIIKR